MNTKKLIDVVGLALIPIGVAVLFLGIGNASRGEESLGAALVVAGVAALVGAFRALRGSGEARS
jgi:uncharacterized membrane protein HdeD (DUF308 family)